MALFEINREPNDRTLRQFAAIGCAAMPIAAWMLTHEAVAVGGGAIVGLGLFAVLWQRPQIVRRPFVAASYVTAPIGMVVGELMLLAMYFGVFLPIGLVFKIIGRDPLERKIDRAAPSYWKPKRTAPASASYLRQF